MSTLIPAGMSLPSYVDACVHLGLDPKEPLFSPVTHKGRPLILKPHQAPVAAGLDILCRDRTRSALRGAILADDCGLGKTASMLIMMHNHARWASEQKGDQYKPMVVLAPAMVVRTWHKQFTENFAATKLELMVYMSSDESLPKSDVLKPYVISDEQLVRSFMPGGRLDPEDPRTAFQIILSSYDTWRNRTLYDEAEEEQALARAAAANAAADKAAADKAAADKAAADKATQDASSVSRVLVQTKILYFD